jgi:hypothetical protein
VVDMGDDAEVAKVWHISLITRVLRIILSLKVNKIFRSLLSPFDRL